MREFWKDIKGYEGLYQVSNQGGVRSVDRQSNYYKYNKNLKRILKGKKLSQIISKEGYLKVYLSKDGKKTTFLVHRLVASHFLETSRRQNEVNHIDSNKVNNNVDNLERCSRLENMDHAFETNLAGFGENCNLSKLTKTEVLEIVRLKKEGMKSVEISKIFNVHKDTVNRIVSGRSWSRVTGIKRMEVS